MRSEKSAVHLAATDKFVIHRTAPAIKTSAIETLAIKARLVLFPFSGGNALAYKQWFGLFPDWLEIYSVQMPGRGNRQGEPFCDSVEQVVDDLIDSLAALTDDLPLFFFGHSLGARIAYACCKRLRALGQPLPATVFVSASKCPDTVIDRPIAALSDEAFIRELSLHGGIAENLQGQTEILQFFLPIVRADMALFESYRCDGPSLPTSLVLLGGQEDRFLTHSQLYGWTRYFHLYKGCQFFPGGHFYINAQYHRLVAFIIENISGTLQWPSQVNPITSVNEYAHD